MATKLTQDDALEAIRLALQEMPDTTDGMTTHEMATKLNMTPELIRRAVARLIEEGTMEPCAVKRKKMTGQVASRPGYRFKTP